MGHSDYFHDDLADVIDLDMVDLTEPAPLPASITTSRIRSERLVRAGIIDELTGLENRRGLTCALFDLDEPDAAFAIGVIDLDDFADVNRRYGRTVGDAVLAIIAGRLVAAAPTGAQVYRPGGNEFVVLVPGAKGVDELEQLAASLMEMIQLPLGLPGGPWAVTASLGWATTPAGSPVQILAQADAAMYRAKREGGACHHTHWNFDAIW